MKSLSQARIVDTLENAEMTVLDEFRRGLATRTPSGNHVLELLVDIGAILFNYHDTERAVVGRNTRGSGHRGVKLLVDDVLHHSVDRRAIDEAHGPRADAFAVSGVVFWWENNPVVQFELTESHPEIVQGTVAGWEYGAGQEVWEMEVQTFVTPLALGRLALPSSLVFPFRLENHWLLKRVRLRERALD